MIHIEEKLNEEMKEKVRPSIVGIPAKREKSIFNGLLSYSSSFIISCYSKKPLLNENRTQQKMTKSRKIPPVNFELIILKT